MQIDNIKCDFLITVIVAVITFGISVAILSCQTADTYKNEKFYEDYIEIINELNEKKKEQWIDIIRSKLKYRVSDYENSCWINTIIRKWFLWTMSMMFQ